MLSIRNINLTFKIFTLDNVSLDIGENECVSIIGPTGSGKSCILRSVAGVYKVRSGEIYLNGLSVHNAPPEDRNVGLVFQEHTLFPNMNVYGNIAFGLRIRKMDDQTIDKKVREYAELFRIEHLLQRSIKRLSGGEKQRVALARALIIEPSVLLLDEPFSALDRMIREKLLIEFKSIFRLKKMMVLHVTHDQDEASVLADRIAVIHQGKIVQVDTVKNIFRKPNCRFVAEFVNTQNIFTGSVIENNGHNTISWGPLKVNSEGLDRPGAIQFCIRPEYVHVYNEKPTHYSTNVFRGIVKDVSTIEAITQIDVGLLDNDSDILAYEIVRDDSRVQHQVGDEVYVQLNQLHIHHFYS